METVLFLRWRGDPREGSRRSMGFHRPSEPTRWAPASGKPFGPEAIRPKSIGLRLGRTPGTTFAEPLDPGIELPPAERFHPAMKGSKLTRGSTIQFMLQASVTPLPP